ncbi:fumarylacetoacetate hydrolase family protein [Fictibacillus enclensis]|uniref:Fumarylacetoacetate hydrolase family protein n=1 Tax=Fictibacillus terranigra TaxID=3058424 RepID=A0ABT8EBV7_9BACL|nr:MULTISPECIES: fumarylacetoacetate hydrolase family protein [Fictibacillus]MDM5196765.1 fumarylacetoacetate hydrolase family protein [Fictibacillus enclensis]MDN4075399.1 fumarylacetoacetate hydrolase family protein [Fictibacillus sp. CENA-BCM004]SFE40536.1 2-oxo-3-hexenedioate decarboxylase [Bacillus sp. OV194]
MSTVNYQSTAEFLHRAETEKKDVFRITADYPDMTIDDAYKIQEKLVAIKLGQGHRVIGPKMGLTSQAKMKQMNVEEPIYGYIFDYMVVPEGGALSMQELIHPKVEAEIAFVLGKDIEGPGMTGAQVLAATEYVVPALEIIDSRYENFKFTLPDVIADNASSSRVVIGNRVTDPAGLELDLVGVTLSINGEIKDFGAGAAVVGHPANSIAMLANMLARKGEKLKAGDVILSGAVTGAVMLSVGDTVSAKLDGLGEVSFKVIE